MYFVMSVGNEVSCDVEYRDMSKSAAIKLDGFHRCNFPDAICCSQRLPCRRTPIVRPSSDFAKITNTKSLSTEATRQIIRRKIDYLPECTLRWTTCLPIAAQSHSIPLPGSCEAIAMPFSTRIPVDVTVSSCGMYSR